MKVLTLWQPWASLIALGAKQIETRSWSTDYRGPLAIHAAKHWTEEEKEALHYFNNVLRKNGLDPLPLELPLSSIIAIAELSDVVDVDVCLPCRSMIETEFGDYSAGRFAWLLDDIQPLPEPIKATGYQFLWEIP